MNNVQTGLEYAFTGNLHKCNHDKKLNLFMKSCKTRKNVLSHRIFTFLLFCSIMNTFILERQIRKEKQLGLLLKSTVITQALNLHHGGKLTQLKH